LIVKSLQSYSREPTTSVHDKTHSTARSATDILDLHCQKFNGLRKLTTIQNKRAIGGNRVIAQFSFFLGYELRDDIQATIFRGSEVISIFEMELSNEGERVALFNNIKVKLIREKRVGQDYGIIVKFVQITEVHLDKLNALVQELPVIESDTVLFSDDPNPVLNIDSDVWEFCKKHG